MFTRPIVVTVGDTHVRSSCMQCGNLGHNAKGDCVPDTSNVVRDDLVAFIDVLIARGMSASEVADYLNRGIDLAARNLITSLFNVSDKALMKSARRALDAKWLSEVTAKAKAAVAEGRVDEATNLLATIANGSPVTDDDVRTYLAGLERSDQIELHKQWK